MATYTGTDPEGVTVTWSLSGDDAEDFEISEDGMLTFKVSPNFEAPADMDTDNVYMVTVEASDGTTDNVMQAVTVTVTNVDEPGDGDPVGGGRMPSRWRRRLATQSRGL